MARQRASDTEETEVYTPAQATEATVFDIAKERQSLLDRAADLEKKLTAGKQAEFERLAMQVHDFNLVFNEKYALLIPSAPTKTRKCSVCHQPGHRAKACPTKAAGVPESDPARRA